MSEQSAARVLAYHEAWQGLRVAQHRAIKQFEKTKYAVRQYQREFSRLKRLWEQLQDTEKSGFQAPPW